MEIIVLEESRLAPPDKVSRRAVLRAMQGLGEFWILSSEQLESKSEALIPNMYLSREDGVWHIQYHLHLQVGTVQGRRDCLVKVELKSNLSHMLRLQIDTPYGK